MGNGNASSSAASSVVPASSHSAVVVSSSAFSQSSAAINVSSEFSSANSSSAVMVSSVNVLSSSSIISSSGVVSSQPVSSMAMSSSVASAMGSSSSAALAPMVACDFGANLNGGNYFNAEKFHIVNSDTRNVAGWTATLVFPTGNISNIQSVLRDPTGKEVAKADLAGNTITVTGGAVDAMTTRVVTGLQFGTSGVMDVPVCNLAVELEGSGPAGGPEEPLAPPEYVVTDLQGYFAQFPCGVDFSAMGNGGYAACYRTEHGTAKCISKAKEPAHTLKWQGGGDVTDVLHVSGSGQSNYAAVVTTDGALYAGGVDGIPKTPIFPAGVVSTTGAYDNSSCALIGAPGSRRIECWRGNLKKVEFPEPVEPVQISGSYGASCALSSKGEVWCWQQGGGAEIPGVQATPSKMAFKYPIIYLSVGQRAVCGVRATGGVDCFARYDDAFFLPVAGDGDASKTVAKLLGDVAELQAGFVQGVLIKHDGTAVYAPGAYGVAPRDTSHFIPFEGVTNAVASGGKRYAFCVLTADGDVKCLDETTNKVISFTGEEKAQTAACPY